MRDTILNAITEKEYDMITRWRKAYAIHSDSDHCYDSYSPTREVLREWANAKDCHLFKMMEGNLIFKKEIEYERSPEEIGDDLERITWNPDHGHGFGREKRSGYLFWDKLCRLIYWHEPCVLDQEIRNGISALMTNDCLSTNKYTGDTFEIKYQQNGKEKKFRVSEGCKTIKALGKIAEIYNLPGFEDYRICHSQVLNQKKLKGNLCISIHPMDYMTMSDNACGWDSCMSWVEEGGYRQGTVECMNSPTVVVAYLDSQDQPMYPFPYSADEEVKNTKWSNKKWRQLFVVAQDVLIAVKDYPYHNQVLSLTVLDWLKELVVKNLGWEYDKEPIKYTTGIYQTDENGNETRHIFSFETDNMYNDFHCQDFHWAYVNMEQMNTKYPIQHMPGYSHDYRYVPITYSGYSQCMVCGVVEPDLSDEGCLACENCEGRERCEYCGDIIHSDGVCVNGSMLCYDCYENNTVRCDECDEDFMEGDVLKIFYTCKWSEEEQTILSDRFFNEYPYTTISTDNDMYFPHKKWFEDIYMCDYCARDYFRRYLNDDAEVKYVMINGGDKHLMVYLEDFVVQEALEDVLKSHFGVSTIDEFKKKVLEEGEYTIHRAYLMDLIYMFN